MAAGVAGDEVAERVLGQLEEGVGRADGDGYAEPVAQPADVLDGGPPVLAGHPDGEDTSVEHRQPQVVQRRLPLVPDEPPGLDRPPAAADEQRASARVARSSTWSGWCRRSTS